MIKPLRYIIFAFIATAINLTLQFIILLIYHGCCSLYIALFLSTLSGLIIKYELDKRWIFYTTPSSQSDNLKKFSLYSFMGIFTTIIFWGFEIAFDYFMQTPSSKFIGGLIGLTLGYIIKYYLDKKYVFQLL